MKIITLAAGRGSRVQRGLYVPKPLVQVEGRSLLEWTIESFHSFRNQERIAPEDLVFVFLEKDYYEFRMKEKVENFFGNGPQIVLIEDLTEGPAATAKLAIEKLLRQNIIDRNEPVIISDCDHYFRSHGLTRVIGKAAKTKNDIVIFETEKNPTDLSWSFLIRISNEIDGIVEKPNSVELDLIDISRGVVGVYYFPNSYLILDLYEKAFLTTATNERFMSNLITHALKYSTEVRVSVGNLDNFVPLGSVEQIEIAVTQNLLRPAFREAATIFLDLDGTLVFHDSGGRLGSGSYRKVALLNEELVVEVNDLYNGGNKIILTTARSEANRQSLEIELNQIGLMYDELVMGLTGGPRVIVNDSKPSLPGFPSVLGINTVRNEPSIHTLTQAVHDLGDLQLIEQFPGESGEVTVLLEAKGRKFVRKVSQPTSNSRQLIRYQAEWLKTVREFVPSMVPSVITLEDGNNRVFSYFDMEYIDDLNPLGSQIFKGDFDKVSQVLISRLNQGLQELYESFRLNHVADMTELYGVVHLKVLPGLKTGLSLLGFDSDAKLFPLEVNGQPVFNPFVEVQEYLSPANTKLQQLLASETYQPTLIHGDATLSNIMIGGDETIYLLDPIGTRVLPHFDYSYQGLGRTSPVYDHARIRLSLHDEYERWHKGLHQSQNKKRFLVDFEKDQRARSLYEYFDIQWDAHNPNVSSFMKDLVYFTTLARIFPYKSRVKKKEAFYILHLICNYWNQLRESLK